MNVIKFNNTEFPVTSYSKTTNFSNDIITSNAYAGIQVTDMTTLNALAETTITSIQIFHENVKIYDTGEIDAHIDSINESMGEDQMYVSVNLTFNME